jgi:DNA transformation protein and related proteins
LSAESRSAATDGGTEGFKDFVRDLFADFGPVSIRHMFGGAGVYADGVMFAILVDDVLYLRADDASRQDFAREGMKPFTYRPAGKGPVSMPYWEVPPRLLEEPEELAAWAREAHRIARASKTAPPRKRRRL